MHNEQEAEVATIIGAAWLNAQKIRSIDVLIQVKIYLIGKLIEVGRNSEKNRWLAKCLTFICVLPSNKMLALSLY